MEATGVYRWTDPNDPEGAKRRPETPIEEPAWLTDRPAPRSAYLFGDDPEGQADAWPERHPAQTWRDDRPTAGWQDEPTTDWAAGPTPQGPPSDPYRDRPEQAAPWSASHHSWSAEEPTHRPAERPGGWRPVEETGASAPADWTGEIRPDEHTAGFGDWSGEPSGWSGEPDGRTDGWSSGHPGEHSAYGVRPERWSAEPATGSRQPAVDDTAPLYSIPTDGTGGPEHDAVVGESGVEGRHRSRRRIPRPLIIGGAAAAATLVVSLGVGALALPGGGGAPADPTAVDDTVAAAPALPTDAAPVPATTSAAPTASPSTARPTPSASRTTRPTPSANRTTAPSRRNAERSSAPSTGGGTTTAPSGGVSAQAREVVDLVNAERAKAGCKALTIDDKLMTAAQRHSQDQADHQNMSHTGSDGSDPGDRIDRVGYQWRTYGENVAWNQKNPAAVMDAWMNSPGHKANILNCAFTEIGVGIANSNGPYWTQDFAAPR
ncbi:CAP domain-containing protein [Micromonospora musae]